MEKEAKGIAAGGKAAQGTGRRTDGLRRVAGHHVPVPHPSAGQCGGLATAPALDAVQVSRKHSGSRALARCLLVPGAFPLLLPAGSLTLED